MNGAIPPLPQYAFMAWFLVKHRDNFTSCEIFYHDRAACSASILSHKLAKNFPFNRQFLMYLITVIID
jgi:hypothetical protein